MPPVDAALVGRDRELARADALLDRVLAGRDSVLVVSGDAGIGKTTLIDAVARRAAARGFAVSVGRCAASEAPPYWPWPRVLRALGAPDGGFAASAGGGRAALFAAAADRLEQASAERPVLVAIDDLQWADESALALASFLVAATAGLRVALAFGVRDEPADTTPALDEVLAALPANVLRLPLAGLDVAAATEVVRDVLGYQPAAELAGELHHRTGGNPLFLQECARLLAVHGGAAVPDRVRQVITRRLARLGEAAYGVLAAAAVADDFDADLLAALAGTTPAAVAAGIAEAVEARLVVLDDDGHRFVHALIRETLLDTQPTSRRADLHRAAAQALEERLAHPSVDDRAALAGRAAGHWAKVPGGRARAARLAVDAARSAASRLAYDHAARLYRWARELGDGSLETLTELGEAQVLAGQLAEGRRTLAAGAARAAAERRGDALARAVLSAGSGVGGYEVDVQDEHQLALLRDALSLLGGDDSRLRAATLARLALVDDSLAVERRAELAQAAAAMAGRLGDLAGEVAALAARCDVLSGPDHVDERLATTARMVELAQRHGDPVILLLARRHRLVALLERGRIAAVDEEIATYARTAGHLRLPLYSWIVPVWRGMRALMEGDEELARSHCDRADELGRAAGSSNADALVFTLRFALARAAGSTAAMADDVERQLHVYERYPAAHGLWGVHLLLSGRGEEARGIVRRRLGAGVASIPKDSEWLEAVWNFGDVAAALGELDAVEALHDALVPYADLWAVDGIGAACYGVVAHQLGRLSLALGRHDAARRWLDAALDAHRSAGASGLAAGTVALLEAAGGPSARRAARPPVDAGSLERAGAVWRIRWHGNETTVRHSKGVLDIARLLSRPGEEVHVLDLVEPGGAAAAAGGGVGPLLDDRATRAYRERLREIEDDLDEATAMADEARVARLRQERDLLVAELARAYGLGGRARTAADPVERARKAVSMRIATALRAMTAADPALGRHLDRSIVTGRYCSYRPETDTTWHVTT